MRRESRRYTQLAGFTSTRQAHAPISRNFTEAYSRRALITVFTSPGPQTNRLARSRWNFSSLCPNTLTRLIALGETLYERPSSRTDSPASPLTEEEPFALTEEEPFSLT